ncbi:hypothetical protein V3425_31000, partial [Pseudomonas aeruginosa]
ARLLDLADVDADAHLDAQLLDLVDDLERAVDGLCGRIESGEEAIAGGVELATTVLAQRGADKRVMLCNQVAPGAITQLGRVLG